MNIYLNKNKLNTTSDILDLMTLARGENTNKVLIESCDITPDFFDLKSGVAGEFLQKFINYYMDVAFVIKDEHLQGNPRFKEMVGESNSIGGIGYFSDKGKAQKWLQGVS